MSLHAREDGLQDREFRSHAWEAGLHLLGGEFARSGGRLARVGAGMDENQSFLKSRWKKFFFFGALAAGSCASGSALVTGISVGMF